MEYDYYYYYYYIIIIIINPCSYIVVDLADLLLNVPRIRLDADVA